MCRTGPAVLNKALAACSALPIVVEGTMVRRRLGNGSAAAPPRGQGGQTSGQQYGDTAAAAAPRHAASDGIGGLTPAAEDKLRKQRRRKATGSAVAPEQPAETVQAQADASPVAQTGVDPMHDAVRSKKRRKRVDSDTVPDGGAHPIRGGAAATAPPDSATGVRTAAAVADTLLETDKGADEAVQQRSRKRKQQQEARTHGDEGHTATEAQLATAATDDTHGAGPAAGAGAMSPSHATEQNHNDGGHAAQQDPKRRRNKPAIEQAPQQPPGPLSADPYSKAAGVMPAAESGRTEGGEALAEQPKKRRRRDVPQQPRPQAACVPGPQMAAGAAGAADQEGRINTDGLPAKLLKGKKAKAAKSIPHPDNGSHSAPTNGEAAAPVAAEGGAVRAAGAGVAIHGDGPAWREHAARNDVRTGRYSESEKQTIRDAVAQCAQLPKVPPDKNGPCQP